MATIYQSLTTAYAKAIYKDGTKRFSEIRPEYVEPVKKHAAANYTDADILSALDRQFITDQEFDETMNYKYPPTETTTETGTDTAPTE